MIPEDVQMVLTGSWSGLVRVGSAIERFTRAHPVTVSVWAILLWLWWQ